VRRKGGHSRKNADLINVREADEGTEPLADINATPVTYRRGVE
jgi:hypothetical protein